MTEREYKDLVLDDFDHQLKAKVLPPELVSCTRKSIKDLCAATCARRFDKKDEPVIRSFVGERENKEAYMKAFQKKSADDFRTLHAFIHDRSINTAFGNINLLAWLIDFKPRPYHPDLIPPVRPDEIESERSDDVDVIDGGEFSEKAGKKFATKNNKKMTVYIAIIILVGLAGFYVIFHKTGEPNSTDGCMIWADDRYKQVPCSYKSDNEAQVIGLDTMLFKHFKRITEDTLTAASEKKVWYIKIGDGAEYYTAPGLHPVQRDRRLLPASIPIINKYKAHR